MILKPLLAAIGLWFLERADYSFHQQLGISDELMTHAEKLVRALSLVGPSGEYRRHQALSMLLKAGYRERDAAMAIELAVRNVSP